MVIPLQVVVLEDNPRDAKLVVEELRQSGYDANCTVVDSEEAFLAALRPDLDLILADGNLPEYDAGLALRHLRQRGLDIPVIVVTGSISDEKAVEYMKQGAADYLLKDRLARLGSAVSQVLQQRRLEVDKRRIEEERNRFFLLSLDMLCILGSDGCFKRLNPAWEATLGWTNEEMQSRSYYDFIHPDDRAMTQTAARNLGDLEGRAFSFENRVLCKNGSYRWLSWNAAALLEQGLIYAAARDITERKLAEERLRENEERLRQITENLREVTYLCNGDLTEMLYISPAYESVWGRTCASIRENPRSWQSAIHPEDRPSVRKKLQMLVEGDDFAEEYRIVMPDGAIRWIRDRRWVVRDRDNRPYRIAGAAEDITEQRLLEAQFRQAQKMDAIGKLAGGVAHDFNNLLTIINGYGEFILEQLPANDPNRELLREITKAGDRASSLTRQLLMFSRKQIVAPRVVDLREVLVEAEKMLRRVIGEDIRLDLVDEPKLEAIKADPGQLDQVLLNLAVNARDAMPQGGTLTIEIRDIHVDQAIAGRHPGARPGPHVLLAVTDCGVGMDAATKAQIFEPFFTTKGEKGTGLGLATVYAIVKQCDGFIEIESELGRGASFRLYFPAAREVAVAGKLGYGKKATPRGSETVLLVEDEAGVRVLSQSILTNLGYNVLAANHGKHGLQIALEFPERIHLVVTDVVMPEMSGREMADQLALLRPDTRFLFLSGYTDDSVIRHGVKEAETNFLQKPFSAAALAQKVREVLDATKTDREEVGASVGAADSQDGMSLA